MELVLTDPAKEDLAYWKKSGNIKVQNRITKLIEDTLNILFMELVNQNH